jgi:CRISPR-associated endonuclease/helicase Cas3
MWAKLGNETWPDKYHPVMCHLIDVAAVTMALWEKVLRPRFRQWIASRLQLDNDAAGRWLAFWSGAHDIGKVSACFQHRGDRTAVLQKRLAPEFDFPVCTPEPHGTLSTTILAAELAAATRWPRVDASLARTLAVAVGGHHGVFPTSWDELHQVLGNASWTDARRDMLAELARLVGVTEFSSPTLAPGSDQSIWMCIAGLTSVADWIGSNQQFFSPVGNPAIVAGPFDIDRYFAAARAQAHDALMELGWLGRVDVSTPISFAELFPTIPQPRSLQTVVAGLAADMKSPGLLIIEAPMGEGKTEAAWYVAECWDRDGGQGTYVALPTMATSNQMFDRVGAFLKNGAGKKNLMLQHGKATLNERFDRLKYAASVYDEDRRPSAVVAEGWFAANKKHGLLAPYGVGTIDQALLAVLQTKHVFVRLFGLAGKCVILDEVHAYDAYMTTLLEGLLRWLSALGCTVVLLSATLPREKRLQLLRAYAGYDLPEPEPESYPRVTWYSAEYCAAVTPIKVDECRSRTVEVAWLDESDLGAHLQESLVCGGCAAVIRNTVGQAQQTYLQLRDALQKDGISVELFHARFPFGRRRQIEEAALRSYGRTDADVTEYGRIVSAPHRPTKSVLVATQVIEQSLDLDFDLMISDVAPVDLVLQRAGRLHRHDRGPRPPTLQQPRLVLIEPSLTGDTPDWGLSGYVYVPFILLRSYVALKALNGVRLPGDLERLVEQVYGTEALAIPDAWQAVLACARVKLREQKETQQLDAMDVSIAAPDNSPLEQQNHQLEDDNPEAASKLQAATRDSDPTIQLVVIYHVAGRDYLDSAGLEPFNDAATPDMGTIRRILDNEVTVSHPGCFAFYVRRQPPKGWKEKGMLRYHRIVRVDAAGVSLPNEFSLVLDHQVGITFATS